MKKYELIRQSILEYYAGKDADSIQYNKFKSDEWFEWCTFVKQTQDNNPLKFYNDSTSQNMCYTAFTIGEGVNTNQLITANQFYIQKSIVGNFVTFYGLLCTSIIYESGKLRHPDLVVVSPAGPFVELFDSVWNLILSQYPNCCYVPYGMLNSTLEEPQFSQKNFNSLLFGYEGDLKTNIVGDIYFTPE